MHVDTAALGDLGRAARQQSADLSEVAAALTAAPVTAARAALGPVADGFLAALQAAVAEAAATVGALSRTAAAGADTATVTAAGYLAAEHRADARLGGVGA